MANIDRAIVLHPYHAAFYYTRGLNHKAKGEGEAALEDFRRACDIGDADACGELD